ncbi:MAG TPA: glycosyltransferase family 9 protein, partial [Steroidobacteraceae bacterium]|nr:glycosyltransferase family 9 protein [Steroidobacteraceae bacterium]
VHWVSLQHGKTMAHPVTNLAFQTWDDTAGLIHNLDAIVSVDTSCMHLAGALNKPLAIMLSGNSVWLFGTKANKFRWYPSARLYRNEGRGYENAIDRLVADIRSGVWPGR